MGLLLIIVLLSCVFIWCKSVYAITKYPQLDLKTVLLGAALAMFGIIWPILMWKITGRIYVLGPPFIYMLFSVITPYFLGEIFIRSETNIHNPFNLPVAHSLFLALIIVLPFLCAYYFLAPDGISVAALLGLKPYH